MQRGEETDEKEQLMMEKQRIEEIDQFFSLWEEEKEKLAEYFRLRDYQTALEPMLKQIESFMTCLFLINNQTISSINSALEEIEKLPIKPLNSKERLSFLLERPSHYHSFIQLSELFTELQKLFKKEIAIRKTKTRLG